MEKTAVKKVRAEADMTKGSIIKCIALFTLPLLAGNFFQQLYNMVDSIIVGNFVGANALGAIGTTNSLNFFFFSLVAGLSVGIGIIVAQYFGFGDEEKVKDAIGNSIWIITVCSVIMAIIGFVTARPILVLLDTDPVILNDAVAYLKVVSIGIVCVGFYNGVSGILRALGDSKTPFIANLVGLATNMVLDPVLILGVGSFPKLGVVGAAIATVTAQAIVMSIMIVGIVIQKKENVLKGTRLFAKIPREYLQGICKIGIPTAIQGMAYCAISMVLTRMISGYGAEAVATQRVGGQIESISWNTADGFAAALNAFIAQNYGAGRNDRVRKGYKASLWTVGIWGLLISAVFIWVPEPIARIFFHEPAAIATAVEYLIIIGFSEAFMCVELTTVGALSGLGRTRLCSIISIAFTSARIPLAIILGGIMGLNGIWWALSSTSIVKGIIFTCTFLWITRKRK